MTKPVVWLANGDASPSTCKLVEELASQNCSQSTIAARLGVPKRDLESRLSKNKGQNDLRLCWERGMAQVEQRLRDRMFGVAMGEITEKDEMVYPLKDGLPDTSAEQVLMRVRTIYVSKGATTESIFLAKSQFGWKEGESDDKKASNVILMLPKARTRAEYFAMLGVQDPKLIAGPVGATGLKTIAPLVKMIMAPPPGQPDEK